MYLKVEHGDNFFSFVHHLCPGQTTRTLKNGGKVFFAVVRLQVPHHQHGGNRAWQHVQGRGWDHDGARVGGGGRVVVVVVRGGAWGSLGEGFGGGGGVTI